MRDTQWQPHQDMSSTLLKHTHTHKHVAEIFAHPSGERGPCELDIPPEDACTLRAVHFTYMLTSAQAQACLTRKKNHMSKLQERRYSWPKVWKRTSAPASADAFSGLRPRQHLNSLAHRRDRTFDSPPPKSARALSGMWAVDAAHRACPLFQPNEQQCKVIGLITCFGSSEDPRHTVAASHEMSSTLLKHTHTHKHVAEILPTPQEKEVLVNWTFLLRTRAP